MTSGTIDHNSAPSRTTSPKPIYVLWWTVFILLAVLSLLFNGIHVLNEFYNLGPFLRQILDGQHVPPGLLRDYLLNRIAPYTHVWGLLCAIMLIPMYGLGLKLKSFSESKARLLLLLIGSLTLISPIIMLFVFGSTFLSLLIGIGTCILAAAGYLWILSALRRRIKNKGARTNLIWHQVSFWSAVATIWGLLLLAVMPPNALSDQIANWMLASARDADLHAHLTEAQSTSVVDSTIYGMKLVIGLFLLTYLGRTINRLAWFLTRLLKRFSLCPLPSQLRDSYLWTLKQKTWTFDFRYQNAWLQNVLHSSIWMLVCYGALFIAAYYGPVGWWLKSSNDPWVHHPGVHLFLSAWIAMLCTVPTAVGAVIFLPLQKARRVITTEDGFLIDGDVPLSTLGRPFRSWQDVKSVNIVKQLSDGAVRIKMTFHTGGSLIFNSSQFEKGHLQLFLTALDEYADNCAFDEQVAEFQSRLSETLSGTTFSTNAGAEMNDAANFRSTIFIPYSSGEQIPVGNLRVVRQLASKPLSAVYVARDKQQQLRIVKQFVLPSTSAENDRLKELFTRECELLKTLDHPAICRVVEVFDHGNSSFLVLEHSPGEDLQSLVSLHGAQPERVVIGWAKQLSSIMSYLHDNNVVHRDLTPDNIVIGEDNSLRVIDFGAAHQFLEGVTGTLIGKQCYVAPEQLRGKASSASDIYSFGGTLFYLLTGKDPRALTTSSPAEHTAVSEELANLVKQCTAFDVADRPASFCEIAARLDSLSPDSGVKLSLKKPDLQPVEGGK